VEVDWSGNRTSLWREPGLNAVRSHKARGAQLLSKEETKIETRHKVRRATSEPKARIGAHTLAPFVRNCLRAASKKWRAFMNARGKIRRNCGLTVAMVFSAAQAAPAEPVALVLAAAAASPER